MFDWLFHECPKCGVKSRRRIIRNELKFSDKVDGARKNWNRGGHMQIEEPYTVWVYDYEVEHMCRACGHRWVVHVTKQRPW